VDWYGTKMMLRQSNQLYKQMLCLSGVDRLYEIGPFWRAEQNPTPRHLSEAYGLDVEIAGVTNVEELVTLVGRLLENVTNDLYKKKIIKKEDRLAKKIRTISYDKAIELLNKNVRDNRILTGTDFGYDLERELADVVFKMYKTDLFAIINYPESVKKFYTKRGPANTTLSFDIIYRGWEIVSGAVRETNYERLENGIKDLGFNPKKYQFYLDAFKNPRPHGGFCIGVDRFLVKLMNLKSLRDVVFFPRSEYDIIP
jgi:nondiscriminating aspartyl-tRNA synthetase